jgi:predicted GIY-YIG superfamily endonuclease
MKKYYVYELINLMGSVEWVGETYRPKIRMYQHTKTKPSEKHNHGKFFGRQDILMNIVEEFDNRKDALKLELVLKILYGLPTPERDNLLNNSRKNGLNNSIPVFVYKRDGAFVGEYYSGSECARVLKIHQAHVSNVASGKRNHTNGYIIKYKESI